MSYNFARDIDRFYEELIAGQLGVRARPARTMDAFELYRLWAHRNGLPPTSSPRHFVTSLITRHPVTSHKKRFALGSTIGQGGVLYLAVVNPPARTGFEADWLGEHVLAFATDVAAYQARALEPEASHETRQASHA
ncbi:hypothetical protein ACFONC_05470 [Luteimonas soli]|uniref:DNA primase/nucleoside triphosphatase C-terminal domain-containing protein n=1 Tax=Luteimonas soli TaxID=1648966 RepID=A0ABV7XJB1_9GAMM